MNLQGNGSNHNKRPNLNDDNESFIKFRQDSDYERITGQSPSAGSFETSQDDTERSKKLQEAIDMENSSAYEDLDDFIYRQNKKRTKTSGRHHHHRHRSPSVLSPGHKRKTTSKPHKHKHHFHRHHHRRKRMKAWKKVIIGILAGILAVIIGLFAAFFIMVNIGKSALLDKTGLNIAAPDSAQVQENGNYLLYKGQRYKYNDNITTILCMGIDKESFSSDSDDIGTGGDADTLFLLAMDLESGNAKIITISRDTMAEIGVYSPNGSYIGTRKSQICLAYAYGDGKETSCHNQLVAVRQLFYNLPINSYISLDMDGIGPINDSVGGVDVISPETIKPFKEGEKYSLYGSMATQFVRTRTHATIDGNSLRMQRQKAYLESFASKVLTMTKEKITTPLDVFNTASPYVCTNIDAPKVSYFTTTMLQASFKGFEIENVPGELKDGGKYAEFYVDEEKFFELFLNTYYKPVN